MELKIYKQERDLSEKDYEVLKKLYEEGIYQEEKIKNIEKSNLENEKIRFENYLKRFQNVDTIISFISISKQETEAFEKTLYLFNGNIKKMILLYTDKSKYKIDKIKEKYNKLEIIEKNIENDSENFNEMSKNVLELINENCNEYDNLIIDNTLGFKMISFALYKISTELNIKTINWKQTQLKDKKKWQSDIIPGSDRYNIIEIPKLENYILYQNINKAVDNFNFMALEFMYSHTNNYNKEQIYKFLNTIFSEEYINNYSKFLEKVNENKLKIQKIKLNLNEKKEFNRILLTVISIADNKRDEEFENEKNIEMIEESDNWKKLNMNDIFFLNKEQKYFLWRYITICIAEKRYYDKEYLRRKGEEFIKEDIRFDKSIGYIEKNLSLIPNFKKFWDKYKKTILYYYYYSEINEGEEKVDDIQDIEEFELDVTEKSFFENLLDFKEKINRNIFFQNGYLYIEKYNFQIKEEDIFKKRGMEKEIILKILENYTEFRMFRDKKDIKNIIREYISQKNYNDEPSETSVDKALSRIWKGFSEFNENIKKAVGIEDFFVIDNKKIKINEKISL